MKKNFFFCIIVYLRIFNYLFFTKLCCLIAHNRFIKCLSYLYIVVFNIFLLSFYGNNLFFKTIVVDSLKKMFMINKSDIIFRFLYFKVFICHRSLNNK